jgi:hypothetical protein
VAREPGVVATSETEPTVVDVNDHDDDHDRDVQHARVS